MKGLLPFLLAVMTLLAATAWADTDQRCLSACIDAGQSARACLLQCTYDVKPKKIVHVEIPPEDQAMPEVETPYDVLTTPQPFDSSGLVLPPEHKAAVPKPEIDRVCAADCRHRGFQYDLCTERCAKQACPPNSVLCMKASTAPFAWAQHDTSNSTRAQP